MGTGLGREVNRLVVQWTNDSLTAINLAQRYEKEMGSSHALKSVTTKLTFLFDYEIHFF